MSPTLEDEASEILARDAKASGRPLRRIGILNARRLRRVARKEIPMSELRSRRIVEDT